jgi:hypothetical protein
MKIFIVIGETGEYSDRNEWCEMAFNDKEIAKEYIRLKDGVQTKTDWDERTRYGISEVELLSSLPAWDSAAKRFIT